MIGGKVLIKTISNMEREAKGLLLILSITIIVVAVLVIVN